MTICHIQGCSRPSLPKFPVCGPCRLSYLNGMEEGRCEKEKRPTEICSACGHFVHWGIPCGWHGGSCDDAVQDPTLWCPCDGTHPRGGGS